MLQLIITIFSSAVSVCLSILINEMLKSMQITAVPVFYFIALIIFLLIGIKLLYKLNVKIVNEAGVNIKDNVRTKILTKLFLLGPEYADTIRTGTLTSTFTARVEWLMNYYTRYLPVIVSAVLNAGIFIIFLFYIDIYVGIVSLISVIMMLVIPMVFFKLMKEKGKKEWEEHANYYSECLDGIQGMVSLKAFNADAKYVRDVKAHGENFRKAVMDHLKVTIIEGTFSEFFLRVGTALTIAIMGLRCAYGYIDKNFLIYAFFIIGATFSPMLSLINAWHLGFQGVSGSYSLSEFLETKSDNLMENALIKNELKNRKELEVSLNENAVKENKIDDVKLSFDKISFRYKGADKDTLKDISFELHKGKAIALVGPSGGGKSTIAGLLMGFYRADNGEVLLNGTKLTNETVAFFNDNISAVWQDNHLFYGSIYDNIKMGKPSATDEEIFEASKKAMIYDLIMSLPNGYDTSVDELGSRFSTGERQRIAIARALLKDAPIIIFDEATSALDRENEKYIAETLSGLKSDKAMLMIAHRLSTISMADEILVIEEGSIIDRGSSSYLEENCEIYRRLVKGG
ncbi:MAG: ABC transporter ATP-binding protein/permease [Catonella sp.]|uniref:ABC transporter ATP-binding protein/permease n=1 Tax=Catonella sp. TaxID=2382125 RepID=UPI003F9F8EF8